LGNEKIVLYSRYNQQIANVIQDNERGNIMNNNIRSKTSTIKRRIVKVAVSMALATVLGISGIGINLNTASPIQVQAAQQTENQIRVTVDGRPVHFEGQQPVMIEGRVLVPVRGVFEELGFTVGWREAEQLVQLVDTSGRAPYPARPAGAFHINITIGDSNFNTFQPLMPDAPRDIPWDNHFVLDVPAQIINGSTMLPIRAVVEAAGYFVEWDSGSSTVVISTSANNVPVSIGNAVVAVTPPVVSQPVEPTSPVVPVEPTPALERVIVPVLFDRPTLLTNTEISTLIENSPTHLETRSRFVIPANRRITDTELLTWIDEYEELGGINVFELEVIGLINEERVNHGLQPLMISMELSMAARFHSQDMLNNNFFAHTSPNNGSSNDRQFIFNIVIAGENIAARGQDSNTSPSDHMQRWMNSSIHRAAILRNDNDINIMGIGVTDGGGLTFKSGHSDAILLRDGGHTFSLLPNEQYLAH